MGGSSPFLCETMFLTYALHRCNPRRILCHGGPPAIIGLCPLHKLAGFFLPKGPLGSLRA